MHARGMRRSALALAAIAASGGALAATIGNAAAARRPPTPAPAARHYKGLTSQHQPISFTLGSGHVSKLSFWMVLMCASHRRYRVQAYGFAPIPVAKGRFHQAVTSAHPMASATVSGRFSGRRATGSLEVRRYVRVEHRECAGSSTFALTVPARSGHSA